MKPASRNPGKKAGAKSSPRFDQGKEVRAIARERVGAVKPALVIEDKKERKKPKHKLPAGAEPEAE